MRARRFTAFAHAARLLNGWARRRAVRAEYTAIARSRADQHPAAGAFVKKLAGVGRHRLELRDAALRASEDGLQDHRFVET